MNENLFIWTSDWHVTSDDSDDGIVNETFPSDAADVAAHIASLAPAGVIDTGDCKDHFGAATGDQHDRYIESVRETLPWATVRADSGSALLPILPGNHDEVEDYISGSSTDLSLFDTAFWPGPYHWACDWEAAQIRFLAIHSYIHHSQDGFAGAAHVDTDEVTWLEEQLDALPANWQAIVCSHYPANPAFGNHINFTDATWTFGGPHPLRTLIADNSERIAAYFNGHRHANMGTDVLDGVTHFNGPSVAYTLGNGYGGWAPITYDPDERTLTLDYLYGPPHPGGYTRVTGFTPIVLDLPQSTALTNVAKAA